MHETSYSGRRVQGFTLLEVLIGLVLSSMLIVGLVRVMNTGLDSGDNIRRQNHLNQQAQLAMRRMVDAVRQGEFLFLPQHDNPATVGVAENIRSQTFPVPPGSTEQAVLAVSLHSHSNVNFDAWNDSDNDRDTRIDEDPPSDWNNDFAAGIYLFDDDRDGSIDEGNPADDDEDGLDDEDGIDGIDNDGDGRIDEDPGGDFNLDGCAGLCGADEDGDGFVDETETGGTANNDEDDSVGEDWHDSKVFYLDNANLVERTPVDWDVTANGSVTGQDFIEEVLTDNVSSLLFERQYSASTRTDRVRIVLQLRDENGNELTLETSTRIGAAR